MYNEKYKLVAKIFIIISMVLLFPLILPTLLGFFALGVIDQKYAPEDKKTLWGILTIILINWIAGIFILIDERPVNASNELNDDANL
ncbi:hypothetical protein [Metamycoplasma alkalescens]|uniref:Uncharacterized protein n=3 Tax=Metamycoplasma alkalescens TaxID=45363 RepID=N9U0H9_9BACT|nr:hypothetical protein [Metamycoplasma alkalescens]ENY54057.1 Hypothetical protein MALK_1190 [Metamycoplasma alkalescens 14918]PYF43618.1 hypothetical protein BCF88_10342 [Metamycoplasma alkalescens]